MEQEKPRIDGARIAEMSLGTSKDEIDGRELVFSVANAGVTYAGKTALSGVNMDVRKNTVTAFIGPSGCGSAGRDPVPRCRPLRPRSRPG